MEKLLILRVKKRKNFMSKRNSFVLASNGNDIHIHHSSFFPSHHLSSVVILIRVIALIMQKFSYHLSLSTFHSQSLCRCCCCFCCGVGDMEKLWLNVTKLKWENSPKRFSHGIIIYQESCQLNCLTYFRSIHPDMSASIQRDR